MEESNGGLLKYVSQLSTLLLIPLALTYTEYDNAPHNSSVLWVGDLLICGAEKAGLFLVAATGLDNDTFGRHFRNVYVVRLIEVGDVRFSKPK